MQHNIYNTIKLQFVFIEISRNFLLPKKTIFDQTATSATVTSGEIVRYDWRNFRRTGVAFWGKLSNFDVWREVLTAFLLICFTRLKNLLPIILCNCSSCLEPCNVTNAMPILTLSDDFFWRRNMQHGSSCFGAFTICMKGASCAAVDTT